MRTLTIAMPLSLVIATASAQATTYYVAPLGAECEIVGNIIQVVDASRANLRLRPDSQAIDTGTNVTEFAVDIDGLKRPTDKRYDIGAYEYTQAQLPGAPSSLEMR